MKRFLFFLVVSMTIPCFSEKVIHVFQEHEVEQKNLPLARKEATQKAIEAVSLKYIHEILGKDNLKNKMSSIRSIIKNSNRYIYSVKTSNPIRTENGYRIKVSLSFSLKTLQDLLLKKGLFYQIKGTPKVLFLVEIEDSINSENYSWWKKKSEESLKPSSWLEGLAMAFHANAHKIFKEKSFYVFQPIKSRMKELVPKVLAKDLSSREAIQMASFFTADVFINGKVSLKQVSKDQFSAHWNISIIKSNGRILRNFQQGQKSEHGNFKNVMENLFQEKSKIFLENIVGQTLNLWEKGAFRDGDFYLLIEGDYSYRQIAKFKKEIETLIQIKSLKERKFMPSKVMFHVDSSLNPKMLARILRKRKFKGFSIKSLDYNRREIGVSLDFKNQ